MPNMPEAIYIFYACNKIGAVSDFIHPLSSPEHIKYYLNESKSNYLFLVDFNYEITIKSNIKRLLSNISNYLLTLLVSYTTKEDLSISKRSKEFFEVYTKIIKYKKIKKTKETLSIFC
jgi:acyl-coenzyme A synthetase/AMP-(fatty) acid ligase